MVPKKLVLRNFVGIKSGLNRDELVLDLEKLTDGAQLIALIGPNGAGKSTILDNLHPYRLQPSRASSYSPSAFSFYENVYNTEAAKILEWEHDGHRYRSELIFKMGAKTKKTEAYLFEIDSKDGDDMHPFILLSDNTRSDGKAETYDHCIEAILGTPDMFFSAVFASQNRRPLSSYTNGEIKGLLSELLGLEHIRELGGKANDVAKLLKANLDGMRDDLAKVAQLEADQSSTEVTLTQDNVSMGLVIHNKREARAAVDAATKRLAAIKADLGKSLEVENHRASLQAQFNSVQQRSGATLRQLDADIQDERRRALSAINAAKGEHIRLTGQIASYNAAITHNKQLLSRKTEIENAQGDIPILDQEADLTDNEVIEARAQDMKYRTLVTEQMGLKARLNSIKNEGSSLNATCEGLKQRSALVDQVPCQGTDLQPRCPLLKEAVTARAQIPIADANVEAKRQEYTSVQAREKDIETALAAMGNPSATLKAAEEKQQQISDRLKKANQLAALAHGLAQAEKTIKDADTELSILIPAVDTKVQETTRLESESLARLTELGDRRMVVERDAQGERKAIETQLAALPPPADDTVLGKAELDFEAAERAQAEVDLQADTLNAKIAAGKERLRTLTEQLQAAGAVRAKAATIEAEIAHWTTLSKALGNDGVIALCIDDAGPTLASLTNDLLACYSNRFSIRIETQQQTQKGVMKEGFDVLVFDSERDESKSITTTSGGEKIYLNDALCRAIALYQASLSGRQYGCLFSDESDGALDASKKMEFMKVKREVLRIGQFSKEFYISHSKEVQDCADAIIDLEALRQ